MALQQARDGARMHREESGALGSGVPSGTDRVADLEFLDGTEFAFTSTHTSLKARLLETGVGAFADHGAFKLRKCANHLHHHASRWGGGVDGFGEAAKPSASSVDAFHESEQVFEAATEAVELPDDDHVPGAEVFKHGVQFGAVPASAGSVFLVEAFGSGVFQGAELRGGVLVAGVADAGVTDAHVAKVYCHCFGLCNRLSQLENAVCISPGLGVRKRSFSHCPVVTIARHIYPPCPVRATITSPRSAALPR
jgi:hypothetical protein